jgi:glycosyltransferase involved in cell wall biosynthesis
VWKGKKVSVVFPTYNEKDSIRRIIEEFLATGYVDEVIVVNNNATAGTKEEVERTPARQVFESRQGYGHAMQRGMREATGDLIITSEPDGTFSGADVLKLLSYSDNCEVVFGTRTVPKLIEYRANMGMFLRIGNWLAAKAMEFLFLTNVLTDVGCSMKLLSRSAYEQICDEFAVGSSHFNAELMCLVIAENISFIEIPIAYKAREGKSMVTGSTAKAVRVGVSMSGVILKYRLADFFTSRKRRRSRDGNQQS